MRKGFRILAMLALAIGIAQANAAFADITYNDQSTWAAAVVGTVTNVNFESSVSPGTFTYIGGGAGTNTTVGGVNFAVGPLSNGNLFLIGDNYPSYYSNAVVSTQQSTTAFDDLVITLPKATRALGFTFGNFSTDTITVTLSDGTVVYPTGIAAPFLGFFGVTTYDSGATITSVDLTQAGCTYCDALNVGEVDYSTTAPEPSSLALLGAGLASIVLLSGARTRN